MTFSQPAPRAFAVRGFAFTVEHDGRMRTIRLVGSGGLMGDGHLALLGPITSKGDKRLETACRRELMRARRELRDTGRLLEWLGDDLPPGDRTAQIEPRRVIACGPILEVLAS